MDQHNLSIFAPASPAAESIRALSVLVFVITGLIFLVVEGILIVLILRARKRAVDDTIEPPQLYGSTPIEVAWTAAPALIVFVLTLVTTRALWEVNVEPPEAARGVPRALRHGRRPPVVVGVPLRDLRRQAPRLRHGQRAAHPRERPRRRPPRLPDPEVGRRLPQLLGPPAGRQDRPDPGARQLDVVPDPGDRPVRRPVRRILRDAAREHAPPRGRRRAGRLRALGRGSA